MNGFEVYACILAGLLAGWALHGMMRERRRHRGQFVAGDGSFDVSVRRLTTLRIGHPAEKSLNLVIVNDGVYAEVNLGDGSELLKELYEGRTWLYELQEAM